MDLNELFFRHQIALMRAGCARNRGERERQNVAADSLASRIATIQLRGGARATPLALAVAPGACA